MEKIQMEIKEDCGLRFGHNQRTLPSHVEHIAYSFLTNFDLAALFFVSKPVSKQVVRFLRGAKELSLPVEWASADSPYAFQRSSSKTLLFAASH